MTLRCLCVIGGVDIRLQATALISRPHVVVATPGRLMEHLLHRRRQEGRKVFCKLRILVLDEADRLLDPGFEEDLRIIMHNLPSKHRQTLLFSATLTQSNLCFARGEYAERLSLEARRFKCRRTLRTKVLFYSSKDEGCLPV